MSESNLEKVAHESDYHFHPAEALLGAQMLFVAFGALVLVPLLTGFDPNVALFTAGAGTLLFQVITRGQVPVFLASSFAFIPAMIYGAQTWGIPATLSGLAAAGLLYIVLSQVVRWRGVDFLHRILPPVVTGPVIMVIGLMLAGVGVNLAMGKTGDGAAELVPYGTALTVAAVSLLTTVLISLRGGGMLRLVPILAGVAVGYVLSLFMGLVDFSTVRDAPWFAMPAFVTPEWNWAAVIWR
jgi:uracil permease